MTELVAPFVPVHGSWTFLPDMNCLLDPTGRSIRLSVNYTRCRPTDDMILNWLCIWHWPRRRRAVAAAACPPGRQMSVPVNSRPDWPCCVLVHAAASESLNLSTFRACFTFTAPIFVSHLFKNRIMYTGSLAEISGIGSALINLVIISEFSHRQAFSQLCRGSFYLLSCSSVARCDTIRDAILT